MAGLRPPLMKMSPFRFGYKFPSVISLQAFIIVAAVMWILHIAAANEQTHQRLKNPETKGIQITSDKLVAKINDGEIIYTGNVKTGDHELVVSFVGKAPAGGEYRRSASYTLTKKVGPSFVEMIISGPGGDQDIRFKDW